MISFPAHSADILNTVIDHLPTIDNFELVEQGMCFFVLPVVHRHQSLS